MSEHSLEDGVKLPGLDASNPLGFLAALGVLRICDYRARASGSPRPLLWWVEDAYWYPIIEGDGIRDVDTLVDLIQHDQASWADDPALSLAYDDTGQLLTDAASEEKGVVRDLKPPPETMRLFLEGLAQQAEQTDLDRLRWLALCRSLETVGFYGSEVVPDNSGKKTKPFALHFTAGNQTFLKAIRQLRAGVGEAELREALLGPWRGESKLPSMSWDATVARIYALRASDPSREKRGSKAGADWLAFVGLGLLFVAPHGRRLLTAGVRGGHTDGVFTWPVWTPPLTARVVRTLLSSGNLAAWSIEERAARGIGGIFSSRIVRDDKGYGGFAPAHPV